MLLKTLISEAGRIAHSKGWWRGKRSTGEFIALCHSELSEALEHCRNGHALDRVWVTDVKPDGFLVELADVYIRIADFIAQHGLGKEFEAVIKGKMAYNESRPHRHGKKF